MTEPCAELVAKCLAARTAAHMAHLTTRSYSQHVALGEFYEAISEGADRFAEAYQGAEEALTELPHLAPPTGAPLTFIPELRSWLRSHRDKCADGNTELANLVDELLAVCDKAVYRLRFLK